MSVKEVMEKIRKSWMLSGVVAIVLGIILMVIPGFVTKAAGYLLGAAAILFGMNRIIRYFQQENIYPEFFRGDLLVGFLAAGLGLFIMLHVEMVVSLVPVLGGTVLASNGVVGLQRAIRAHQAQYRQWWMLLIFALLTLGLGAILIINPFGALQTAVTMIGAALIYEGVSDILTMLIAGKRIEAWKNTAKK